MDFDTDPARLAQNTWLDGDNPDLGEFRNHGGKILWYHGTADTPPLQLKLYVICAT